MPENLYPVKSASNGHKDTYREKMLGR